MSKATFTFGRFNPPTESGHGKLISAVQNHAEQSGGSHYVFPSHSQDAKKNPLSHEDKVSAMHSLFPSANIVSHPKIRTAIDAVKHLESKGHTNVTMVVGSDRVDEFHTLLNKYKEKEYPKIKKINVVSAGHRDPDAEGTEGMSASKLRGLVSSGKRTEFISHYSDPKIGAAIHDKVKKAMNESENPKALFLLGGPGSGKDYVINNIMSKFNLVEVQLDQILNGSMSAQDLIENKTNLLVNSPADMDKIALVKSTLGEAYDFNYVLVSVTNKVSRERNGLRSKPMNESVRIRKWLDAEKTPNLFEGVFTFQNSINLSEASEKELSQFQLQIEKLLGYMIDNGFIIEKSYPAVKRDKESGLPKKYVSGLSRSTAKARAAHWKEKAKLSDSNPRAYEPAPGDATAKTKPSKYTKKYHAMYGEASSPAQQAAIAIAMKKAGKKPKNEEVELDEGASDTSLAAKAKKSGISLSTLKTVYRRGVAAWNSGHRPGTTPSQWGHARVNSYITKGKTYHTADKDLREATNRFDEPLTGWHIINKKTNQHIKSFETKDAAQKHLMTKMFHNHQDFKIVHTAEVSEASSNVDVTPTLYPKTKTGKKKITPPNDMNARIDGAGGYSIGGLMQNSYVPSFKEFVNEAEYQGREVELNKPMAGDVKKSKVYVRDPKTGNVKKVNFGDKTLSIKKNIPARKRSYCARSSGQGNLTDKTKANYWSRRAWEC